MASWRPTRVAACLLAVTAVTTVAAVMAGAGLTAAASAARSQSDDQPDDADAATTAATLSKQERKDRLDRAKAQRPQPPESAPTAPPPRPALVCPPSTVVVGDGAQLAAALRAARPGTVIALRDGIYRGQFAATTRGTAQRPVFVCGGRGAILDGGGTDPVQGRKGYGFHLNGVSHWRLMGFTVRNSQKGVMADATTQSVIHGLTVVHIGDEGIHLRNFSSDNVVEGNDISDTGVRKPKFGEGIYVGTAVSNWCTFSACDVDRSDRNLVQGNTIHATTAESVDIKEGTSDGFLIGNSFDGAAIGKGADSWVDVKGNGWLIEGNTGRNTPEDGFQTHELVAGWGAWNVFRRNTAQVDAEGWGFNLRGAKNNTVACDNQVSGARKGLVSPGRCVG